MAVGVAGSWVLFVCPDDFKGEFGIVFSEKGEVSEKSEIHAATAGEEGDDVVGLAGF